MKTITLLVLPVILLLSFASSAGISAESRKYSAPIGEWVIEKKQISGNIIEVRLSVSDDRKFSGTMYVNGVVGWKFSGAWVLQGNKFTYIYKESTIEMAENYQDTDIIISVDNLSYKFQSEKTGEVDVFMRVE